MKKFILISILFLLFTLISYGQEEDTLINLPASEYLNAENDLEGIDSPHRLKPHWNLMLGSNFNFSKSFGSSTGIFLAPMLTLPLNNRLSLRGGIVASHTYLYGMGMPDEFVSFNSFNDLSVFGTASYMLSENFEVYGTATKRLTELPLIPYPSMLSTSPNSFTIGTNWRIGNNISVGASFTKTDRYFPFYNSSPFTPGGRSFFP